MKTILVDVVPTAAAVNLAVVAVLVETGNWRSTVVFNVMPAVLAVLLAAPVVARILY